MLDKAEQSQTTNPNASTTNHHLRALLAKNLGWNGYCTTQYHYLPQLHVRLDRNRAHHKSRCQRDNQNCTALMECSASELCRRNLSLSGKRQGRWSGGTLSLQMPLRGNIKRRLGMSAEKVVQMSGGRLARSSPRLVNDVNNVLHQGRASSSPSRLVKKT